MPGASGALAAAAAERAARASYGRLVAWLAYRWRDVAAAEDALSEALVAALVHWPRDGVPASPEAWLMTAAKRHLLQQARHERVARAPEVLALFADAEPAAPEPGGLPDARLRLMLVCAHPALGSSVHGPLMLQTVLGLEAKTIADAYLVAPAAMAQRLVRAKAKIRDARIRFEEPGEQDLPARLAAVLDGIYGAYAIGSNTASHGPDAGRPAVLSELTGEALFLGRLVAHLQPGSAEALGLLALMLYCEARRDAQFDTDVSGQPARFVPLTTQDTRRWDQALIREAEGCLWKAAQLRTPGSFQIEAAIQSAHCQRAFTGQTPWPAIVSLYEARVAHFPSVGAQVGLAVALAEAGRVDAGQAVLQTLAEADVAGYQPYWVARAHLWRKAGAGVHAGAALQRALGLTMDLRIKAHLLASFDAG